MGVGSVLFGRARRPSHFQEWKLFNSYSLVNNRDLHEEFSPRYNVRSIAHNTIAGAGL